MGLVSDLRIDLYLRPIREIMIIWTCPRMFQIIAMLGLPPAILRVAMVPRDGIEPPTLRFSVACSTN